MLSITMLVGFALFTPEVFSALSASSVWSLFSAANIYFYHAVNTGYFAADSGELPLQHSWPLGIEEKFYIIWLFVIIALIKYVRSPAQRLVIVAIIFSISFVLAQWLLIDRFSFSYYMLPTRAWESVAGGL
jgi:peptidoglycan/LPS O-acetylase OafA/YrhL